MKVKIILQLAIFLVFCAWATESQYSAKSLFNKALWDTIRDVKSAPNFDPHNIFSLKFPERPLEREYDFIVVGSGPSGCVIANRLSENGKYSVLILEAGSPESPFTSDLPISSPNLQSTTFNWGYETTPQSRACLGMTRQRCHWPHGKVLGGSSILYYMIYTRGNRRDFDNWARAGNPGWSWDEVLPYFMRSENATLQYADPFIHGSDGPLPVEDVPFRSAVSYAHVQAAREAGYKYVDYNSGDQIGVSFLQQSTRGGRRISAARAYLYPVRFRKNLHIATHSTVKRLIIDDQGYNEKMEVRGVVVRQVKGDHDVSIRARKEVILCGGAFESSKLLMLSGVGPAQHLAELGIPLVKDLPVGQTLYEHMGVMGPVFVAPKANDGLTNLEQILTTHNLVQYLHARGGPLTMNGVESLTYIKTNVSGDPDPGFPDVEIMQAFADLSFDTGGGTMAGLRLRKEIIDIFSRLKDTRAYMYLPMLLHPRSKGFMRLRSRNYLDRPIFEPNFFEDPRDLETLVAGMEEAIRIAGQPALQKKLGLEIYTPQLPTCPYVELGSHEYWRCWAATISATFHHQVATCKMGPQEDPTTVVDHTLRVHGFENLRVADIAIIPQPPSGHTNSYSFMIGEKASDLIKDTWESRSYYEHYPSAAAGDPNDSYNYVEDVVDTSDSGYEPKYFEFRRRRKRSTTFDWQKGSSKEEEVVQVNKTEEIGSTTTHLPVISSTDTSISSDRGNFSMRLGGEKRVKSDLEFVLRPSEVDISHKITINDLPSSSSRPPPSEVIPLTGSGSVGDKKGMVGKSGLEEVLESLPAADEDAIRTVSLDNHAHFGKGKNKPQLITDKLAIEVKTTEFEANKFLADNSTKAVHLPVLHGLLLNHEEGEQQKKVLEGGDEKVDAKVTPASEETSVAPDSRRTTRTLHVYEV